MSNAIERLEALAEKSKIDRLQHVPGIFKHYVASSPCDEYGNAPDEADFAGFSIPEMHPRDGRDVPAEAQARYIVEAINALPALLELARATDLLTHFDCEAIPEGVVAGPDGRCVICTVRAARLALTAEAPK